MATACSFRDPCARNGVGGDGSSEPDGCGDLPQTTASAVRVMHAAGMVNVHRGLRRDATALFLVLLVLAAGCGRTTEPNPSAEPSAKNTLLPSPLLDRCSELGVSEILRDHGRKEVLGLARVSTLDGMFCGFDAPGPDSEMYIQQGLIDGSRPTASLDEILLQGGERIDGIGDDAILSASGPLSGGQEWAKIDFDLADSRWIVEVYGDRSRSDENLVGLVTELGRVIVPSAERVGSLEIADVLADPASPTVELPTQFDVAAVLGAPGELLSTISFSRDYEHRSFHRDRLWFSADFTSQALISLRGGAHSATPREAVEASRAEYNEGVQNPEYLKTDAPTDKPVDGLSAGALVDLTLSETAQGDAFRAYSYTFKRGKDLYTVVFSGRFTRDIGADVFKLVKAFHDSGT